MEYGKTRVSAIVTAYNCGIFLRDALNSILAQTLVPDEILVIDDGSTEDMESIVIEYAPQVRYIRQENMGAGFARNTGIEHTSGDLITFLDCDDIWIEDKTEKQVAMFQTNPDLVIASGQNCGGILILIKRRLIYIPNTDAKFFIERSW